MHPLPDGDSLAGELRLFVVVARRVRACVFPVRVRVLFMFDEREQMIIMVR